MMDLTKLNLFQERKTWIILTLSALILELIALYFQHVMSLKPCVLCIYQRCALFGIILSGVLISLTTTYPSLRISGSMLWMYSAWKGFIFAKKQNDIQSYSSPFITCDFLVNFPSWLPLDKWIPAVFYANGDCTENTWYFLKLEMSQWMMIIFLIYLIIPTILLTAISMSEYTENKNKKNVSNENNQKL